MQNANNFFGLPENTNKALTLSEMTNQMFPLLENTNQIQLLSNKGENTNHYTIDAVWMASG